MQNIAQYQSYLYMALGVKWGIILKTNNVPVLKARLYRARAAIGDPELARLQFRANPLSQDDELWIIKGEKRDAA